VPAVWTDGTADAPALGLSKVVRALVTALVVSAPVLKAEAQTVQVMPFGGYRFGGDLYELVTGTELDIDGAPSVGVAVDVPLYDGLSVTGLFSHQEARVDVPRPGAPTERVRLSIDHWHAGGTQEFGEGRVRPLLTGLLGITRYGGSGDSEYRFSVSVGGGVVLRANEHVGVRLDGRTYAVFVEGDGDDGSSGICTPGVCIIGLDVSIAWQAEFTAGLVVAF
jgi:hypothetical protein